MKFLPLFSFLFLSVWVSAQTRYDVSSEEEFNMAQQQANPGDSIVWAQGTYSDTRMDIDKDGIIVTAEEYGTVLFKGISRVVINGDNITFSGIQYVGGYIANLDVIRVYGSDVLITHVNIQNYTSYKYLRVYESSKRTTISYCNFENRLNKEDQNILSILVGSEPGFHKIQYCSFKNFVGTGNDEGVEPIRIGVSSQLDRDSRTLVEYCYFTQCNGDGEIISHKARQNVYRYNTFENNPVAELVLRHGDEGIVYGNFFLNNMGGIRVREGSSHFIFNNYFEGLSRRVIYLQNESSDPLSDIHIYNNTIITSEELILGSSGSNPPSNVILANNIFANPIDRLFTQDTENETWINNFYLGDLGIDSPSSGLSNTDPELTVNMLGFFQPESSSPVIAASGAGYPEVPLYPGMDYDNEILLDIMKEPRPASTADRAIGVSEFSSSVNVQAHATEMNTGPSYLFDNLVKYIAADRGLIFVGGDPATKPVKISSNTDWTITSDVDWVIPELSVGSGDAQFNLIIELNEPMIDRTGIVTIASETDSVSIEVRQDDLVSIQENIESEMLLFPNPTDGIMKLSNLPSGNYDLLLEVFDLGGKSVYAEEYRIDDSELMIDLAKLESGTYLLNIKFKSQSSTVYRELTRKIFRN